jgi:hypothetical protein
VKSLLWIRIHTDPHWEYGSGSGSRRGKIKMTHKSEENSSARCSLLRDKDFSCSSNVLYGDLGIRKLQCSLKKYFFFSCTFFPIFGYQNPGSGSGSALTKNAGSTTLPEITHKSINTFQYPINATLLIILLYKRSPSPSEFHICD